jgi:ketosteroid isomerase-like protein
MSQEDIEAFERGLRAYNQQDIEALLEGLESRGGVVPGGSEDQGDQVVAIGRLRTRGRASGLVTEAPLGYVTDFRNGIATRIRTYLDPSEALEAAGLSE